MSSFDGECGMPYATCHTRLQGWLHFQKANVKQYNYNKKLVILRRHKTAGLEQFAIPSILASMYHNVLFLGSKLWHYISSGLK